jgi:hypothetical protein
MTQQPERVRLRAYKVGFGDCLLLTVKYGSQFGDGRSERHMLIDFGSREGADEGPSLAAIAGKIADHCQGRLDVVVATHRHSDHISGFGDSSARKILDRLQPAMVIRPWTDIPEERRGEPRFGLAEPEQRFISLLESWHQLAPNVSQFAFDDGEVATRIKDLAALGIKNAKAIATLEDWGKGGRAHYVKAGAPLDLEDQMPGVHVRVLGPPTLDQVPKLTSYAKESEEYWFQLLENAELAPALRPASRARRVPMKSFESVAQPDGLGAAAWLLRQIERGRSSQIIEIVEGFDDVLNNTSVILLLTVGRRSILLPGDAQAENWSFSLDCARGENSRPADADLRRQLAGVDVYKVGHHGSRNATPQRLYKLWRGRTAKRQPLVSVMTTKHGVYEKSLEGKVPKDELITALEAKGPVYNSDNLPADVWWMDVEAPTTGSSRFAFKEGRP